MKSLLSANEFPAAITKLYSQIVEDAGGDLKNAAFVGIHTRGIPLAKRLAEEAAKNGKKIPVGELDINLYRDDLSETADQPILKETKIDFSVDGKIIYLTDDVLYTGRTVRAAMDAIFDLGRPKAIHLVVFARRNGRELPIDASFTALDVKTKDGDNVKVKFLETDGEDYVKLLEQGEY